ncbi:hypothetical protein FBUS_07153 [Fasciolopsis buskii]|uniref:Uncharacterized protein n=1 Tax=Fasciolopsis buskii TaxID=27845 RepID=A0A8E0S4G2_9TREM|nr:hypothetical protein FBUS_07153 [Fasciolopsis buski]
MVFEALFFSVFNLHCFYLPRFHLIIVLPCILFAQLQPFHLRFDTDTVIWLNAFLLTLHVNLSAFVQLPGNESVLDADYEANGCEQNPPLLRIRCEALMPRVRLFFQQNHDLSLFHITLSPGNRFLM